MDWASMAESWLKSETPNEVALAPARAELMRRAQLRPGQHVLDIGPGPGASLLDAADAVTPDGHVTGIEVAPPLAERARARVPGHVTVELGDAATYPFDAGCFDAIISSFGVMFFADPVAAFAHIRTACRPASALTFVCWGRREMNPWFEEPARVAEAVLGPGPKMESHAPGPFAFASRSRIAQILKDSGWTLDASDAGIDTVSLELVPSGSPEAVADLHMTIGAARARMREVEEAGTLTQAQRDEVCEGLRNLFARRMQGGKVRVPAEVHVVRAITRGGS